jgi:hypothetical protein
MKRNFFLLSILIVCQFLIRKIIVICAALCFLGFAGFAQDMDSLLIHHVTSQSLGKHYLQKSRTQSTVGWIMVGGGVAAMVNAGVNMNRRTSGAQTNPLVGAAGLFSTLSGLAFFQSAKVNNTRVRILLRGERITPGAPHVSTRMTAVGISIHLGVLH